GAGVARPSGPFQHLVARCLFDRRTRCCRTAQYRTCETATPAKCRGEPQPFDGGLWSERNCFRCEAVDCSARCAEIMLHCLSICQLTLDHGARDAGKHAVEIANDAIHPAFLARDLLVLAQARPVLKPVDSAKRAEE